MLAKQVTLSGSAGCEPDHASDIDVWTLLVRIDLRPTGWSDHLEELADNPNPVLRRAQQSRKPAVLNNAVAGHGAVASKIAAIFEQRMSGLTAHQRPVDEQQPIGIHRISLYAKARADGAATAKV